VAREQDRARHASRFARHVQEDSRPRDCDPIPTPVQIRAAPQAIGCRAIGAAGQIARPLRRRDTSAPLTVESAMLRALAICAALVFASPAPAQTLRIGLQADPATLDPAQSVSFVDRVVKVFLTNSFPMNLQSAGPVEYLIVQRDRYVNIAVL